MGMIETSRVLHFLLLYHPRTGLFQGVDPPIVTWIYKILVLNSNPVGYVPLLMPTLANLSIPLSCQIICGWPMFHRFYSSMIRNGVTSSFHLVQAGSPAL